MRLDIIHLRSTTRFLLMLFTGTSRNLFESMQLVKIGGNLDANNNIVDYFNGIIAGLQIHCLNQTDLNL